MVYFIWLLSNSNDEFDSTESDELLEDLMSPVCDQEQMDTANRVCTNIVNTIVVCMFDTGCKTTWSLHKVVWLVPVTKHWAPGDKNLNCIARRAA